MKTDWHVLYITSWWPAAERSAGTFVEMQVLALQSRGCRCAVLISGEATLGNYTTSGFDRQRFLDFRPHPDITFIENLTIHPLPLRFYANPLERRKQNILRNARKNLEKYIADRGKPDIIFHHGVFDYCYLSDYLRHKFSIPVWLMEHSPNMHTGKIPCANPFDSEERIRVFVRDAERRFAVTRPYMKHMSALFGVSFEYCPNVLTDAFFADPNDVHKPHGIFQFVNIAILDPRKNQRLLLEAFADRFRGKAHYKLVIAGDGPLLEDLKAYAQQLGVDKQCSIPGFLGRTEIVDLLDKSHCFVLSSNSETFGVVLIEAMARGLPVIASRIDGPAEIVSARNGLLFTSGDVKELGDAMEKMVGAYKRFQPAEIIDSVSGRFGPDALIKVLFEK